jgi:replicative DNA helicase
MTADPRASAPPYDEHAEAALLGAMMVTREAIRAAHAQQITAADFYVDNHKRFWTAITAVDATGAFPDPITVAAALNGTAETDRPCLIRLQATTPASSNAHAYAAVVADRARRRRLLAVSNELANAARAGTDTTTVLAQVATLTANTDPRARLEPGGQFILDAPRTAAAIWGEDDRVLWAAGESLLIVGPPGVGKTTLTIQLVAGRLGIIDRLLGLPIVASHRILYLACDRPAQIQRAMRRVFTEEHRELLEERLAIWKGPPARSFGDDPSLLTAMARDAGADTVVIDSLKDVAPGLAKDEVGAALNVAIQTATAENIDVLALHHQRKEQAGAKPTTLQDVYGSGWIAAGAGSVVLLWGDAGDPIVELRHLKQPAEPIGTMKVEHDHHAGRTTIYRGAVDELVALRNRPNGITIRELAQLETGKPNPSDNDRKRAERRLNGLVRRGHAHKTGSEKGGKDGATESRYYATTDEDESRLI